MKKTILVAILASTINQAFAGGGGGGGSIVFDPTNFAKNTITAAQSIAMEARQASMYATQLQQLATQLKQQAPGNISMDSQFTDVMNTYRSVQQYQSELMGLQGAVGDVRSGMDKRMNLMAASGLSWDQYIQREREGLKYRQDSNSILSAYERQTMDNAAQRYAKVREMQPKIMGTQGTHESMRTMNTQMNMLTASMQDMIILSAAQGNQIRNDKNEEIAKNNRVLSSSEAYQKQRTQSDSDSWSLINGMMGPKAKQ